PRVLYAWRQVPQSVSANPAGKPYAWESALRAVREDIEARGIEADAEYGYAPTFAKIRYRLRASDRERAHVLLVGSPQAEAAWRAALNRCLPGVVTTCVSASQVARSLKALDDRLVLLIDTRLEPCDDRMFEHFLGFLAQDKNLGAIGPLIEDGRRRVYSVGLRKARPVRREQYLGYSALEDGPGRRFQLPHN